MAGTAIRSAAVLGIALTGTARQEFDAIETTGKELLAAPAFAGKPTIILVAKTSANDELARDITEKRADLARLYPGSDWQEIDSGHVIQDERPEVVITAIRKALALSRERHAAAKARR